MNDKTLAIDYDQNLNPTINPWRISKHSEIMITWKCYICCGLWITIVGHRSNGTGCPHCNLIRVESKGEEICKTYLQNSGIIFIREIKLKFIKTRRYDFYFELKGLKYINEIDGSQHFNKDKFINRRI